MSPRSKLGNDPFQRGAPDRDSEKSTPEPAKKEAAEPKKPAPAAKGKARAPRKADAKRQQTARQQKQRKAPEKREPASAKASPEKPAAKKAVARKAPEKPAAPKPAAAKKVAPAKVAVKAEPVKPVAATPRPESTPAVAATAVRAPTLSAVITPEDAPLPQATEAAPPEQTSKPRLRLLRLEKVGQIEERLAGTVERITSRASTTAAAEELRRMVAFLAGQLTGAESRRAARGLLSRLGQIVAAADVEPPREVDAFGRDRETEGRALGMFEFFYRRYFRVDVRGIENVPASGPVLLVANHSGAIPWDTAMLKCALAFEHPARRSVRPLTDNFVFHFPFLGVFLNRIGSVRACQENAEALLRAGEVVAVFPEGMKGLGKSFRKRYRLQRFGRGGFVRLAMRTGAPVIPVSIVGAEEIHPVLTRIVRPAALFGLPYLPITPTFPWLGPLGLLPLPSKWLIEFGEPMELPKTADDELTIQRLTEDVRSHIQSRLDRLLGERRSVFY